jgi:Icc-related predicted phosphoesterase
MKIVALSDLHGNLPELPPCDVVCICGDIVPLMVQKNTIASTAWLSGPFQKWALELPCEKVIMIWGNHDFVGEFFCKYGSSISLDEPQWTKGYDGRAQHHLLFQNDADEKIVILCDERYEYKGKVFYGTPWCPSLHNWAFYGDKQHLLNQFNNIPDDTDVLITHCPPKYGLQGTVLETNWNYMNDFGCVELQQVIDERFADKDMWILSGHIHSGKHDIEKMNNVKYRNCSIKNEDYEVAYQPFEFEIE